MLEKQSNLERKELAKLSAKAYLQQLLNDGFFHADPHPGNFLITEDEQIAILDYGAIAHLSQEQRLQYTNLLMGLMGFSPVKLGELFRQAGFKCDL